MGKNASYRKHNDRSQNSSTYHKKDGTPVRGILKAEAKEEIEEELEIKVGDQPGKITLEDFIRKVEATEGNATVTIVSGWAGNESGVVVRHYNFSVFVAGHVATWIDGIGTQFE